MIPEPMRGSKNPSIDHLRTMTVRKIIYLDYFMPYIKICPRQIIEGLA
jgi:hypothetical protein